MSETFTPDKELTAHEILTDFAEKHGIEKLEEFMEFWGSSISSERSWPVIGGKSPPITIFDPLASSMPRTYRKATFAHTLMRPVRAYAGSRHKVVLVFDPQLGEPLASVALPKDAKSWRAVGAEMTSAEFTKQINQNEFMAMVNVMNEFLDGEREEEKEKAEPVERGEAFGSW